LDGASNKVEEFLKSDIMKSVTSYLTELIHNYQVVFYNGQLDIIVAYPLTENMIRKLNFDHSKEWKDKDRYIWKVDGVVAGYVKEGSLNFSHISQNFNQFIFQLKIWLK
jgi:vitellogenic carboxypeptidase-like protein